ncbi:Lrp/AsnC family transcriptional regulator [Antarcticibacterium flavum]|uniref:Lrp/AsnC family transcriptional regulator n=1 Tax=Antarcticibacterium flavum TaxID=2058175 RepID=A0A5B7X669_9FLAO|nr:MULTISPECIES: Lrp/AsnC family transcriptional regulator [Antarcticibacterium]MCM4159665.1 AsnC family transcriptional regulator [Antarcticibacterium sp. W02-3]QCY70907.1 Lrp/AsnC family transcriptional regulator [Antarcticibacterium flavum]
MKLDAIDLKILQQLQQDSKITNKELSVKLNLSVTAIYERIKRLERNRVVSKYVALVNPEKVEKSFTVLCQIKLLQHTKAYMIKFEAEVARLPEVLECYHVSGEYDYNLKVMVKDMEAYREFMVTKLTTLEHIGSTQSTFIISSVKNTTVLPL